MPVVTGHPDSPAAEAYVAVAKAMAEKLETIHAGQGSGGTGFKLEWSR